MDIRPIRTEQDHQAALQEVERLFDASPGTPEGDLLEVLATLIEAYEEKHHDIPWPDPIAAILYTMESRGLSRRDLEPYIGSRARVSEILSRKRPLSIEMIRKLHAGLGIPAEVLIQPYSLEKSAA
ncbi:MAG: helix-turn-helix domain-containing protein [Deltaproteobacteria bacterium]|nr:MAG: helix-turn-helix domain-containing protein [Deltaproteobacteria bacterium]